MPVSVPTIQIIVPQAKLCLESVIAMTLLIPVYPLEKSNEDLGEECSQNTSMNLQNARYNELYPNKNISKSIDFEKCKFIMEDAYMFAILRPMNSTTIQVHSLKSG